MDDWQDVDSEAEALRIVKSCPIHWVPAHDEWSDLTYMQFVRTTKTDLRGLIRRWFESDNLGEPNGTTPILRVNLASVGEASWLPFR